MKLPQQVGAVTLMNLRSLPQRLGTSMVIVIGIAGVVTVVVAVLAMAAGLLKTMQSAGRDDRVIVMRTGSTSELMSTLTRAASQRIMDAPGVKHDAAGTPLASTDVLRPIKVFHKGNGAQGMGILRGVSKIDSAVRPEIKIIEGRMFRPAVNEVIVGKGANAQYQDLNVGSRIVTAKGTWTVVGIFASNGDAHESEVLTTAETLLAAYKGQGYSTVTVVLNSSAEYRQFADALSSDPTLSVDTIREKKYFAQQSETMTKVLLLVAYVIGGIMAIGAIFGALNTMYSAVSVRAREIATLRAIGFSPTAIVISVLAEALALAMCGGALGTVLARWLFDNESASTLAGVGTQLVFDIAVTPQVIVMGLVWSACIGLIGGLFPAVHAARRPIATALRAL